MYLVNINHKPAPSTFEASTVGKSHVEMVEWRYFNTADVFGSIEGELPCTDDKIYETSRTRLKMALENKLVIL